MKIKIGRLLSGIAKKGVLGEEIRKDQLANHIIPFQIICIKDKSWNVLKTVFTKKEAQKWIEENGDKYPECKLTFTREGFIPVL